MQLQDSEHRLKVELWQTHARVARNDLQLRGICLLHMDPFIRMVLQGVPGVDVHGKTPEDTALKPQNVSLLLGKYRAEVLHHLLSPLDQCTVIL